MKDKLTLKRLWHFIWHEDSIWSWIVNIILAFVLIKFIVFPVLGFGLATTHPIVAVVSESMEHDDSFEIWWADQREWYLLRNITEEQFLKFPFHNGFNKGDIMILKGKDPSEIELGDILVFSSSRPNPIIHRVVSANGVFQTKGDHNQDSISGGFVDEGAITNDRVIGVAVLRVPYLGWIKILFVDLVNLIR
jgi:signal peptidase I